MADKKSVIKLEVDGVEQFLSTVQQVERELEMIGKALQKSGFKGNEAELKAAAKAYRNDMLKASEAAKKAELERVRIVKTAQVNANKVVSRLTIGRGVAEFAQRIIGFLGDIVEKNKENNAEMVKFDRALTSVQNLAANLALIFLTHIAPSFVFMVDLMERLTYATFGWNLEIHKAKGILSKTSEGLERELELLHDTNLTADEKLKKIKQINEEYAHVLPIMINEQTTQQETNAMLAFANTLLADRNKLYDDYEAGLITRQQLEDGLNMIESSRIERNAQWQEKQKADLAIVNNLTLKELQAKEKIGKLTDLEQRRMRQLLDAESEREKSLQRQLELRQKQQAALRETVGGFQQVGEDIQKDIDAALSKGEVARVTALIAEQINNLALLDEKTKDLNQSSETQLQLQREINKTEGEIIDAKTQTSAVTSKLLDGFFTQLDAIGTFKTEFRFEELFAGSPTDLVDSIREEFSDLFGGDNLIQLFIPDDALSKSEVFKTAKEVFSKFGGEITELIKNLSEAGIKSPILEKFYQDVDISKTKLTELKKQFEDNKNQIATDGLEIAAERKKLEDQIVANQLKLSESIKQIADESAAAAAATIAANLDLLNELGQSEILDAFLAKEAEFTQINKNLNAELEKSVAALQGFGYEVGQIDEIITGVDFDQQIVAIAQNIRAQQELIKNTKLQQSKDFEKISKEFTKTQLDIFIQSFIDQQAALEVSLGNQELEYEKFYQESLIQLETYTERAKKANRNLTDSELNNVQNNVEKLTQFAQKRFETERKIRVSAFLTELDDIEKRGGDVELERSQFMLEEKRLTYDHYQELLQILQDFGVEFQEKQPFSKENAMQIFEGVTDGFQNVFNAYINYQNAVMESAMRALQENLNVIDQRISETTANIDRLESDLEGKRSGRREAVLRGIEIEREREKRLTAEKIRLQRELLDREREAAKQRKEWAIAQAIINTSLAITATWMNYMNSVQPALVAAILAGIQTAALGATLGLEIATIENQQFGKGGIAKFGDGGYIDFGKSHAQGGIPAVIDGQKIVEIERGEAIINKKSTAMYKPLLSKINEAGGGVQFARGGAITDANFNAMNGALSSSDVKQFQMMAQQPIYVNVTDINNMQSRKAQVTDITTL